MGRKRPWRAVEDDEEKIQEVHVVSDDEEDANADLSMAILAKASRKHSLISRVVLSDGDLHSPISVHAAPLPALLSCTVAQEVTAHRLQPVKKQKRKIKKKQTKKSGTQVEGNQTRNVEKKLNVKVVGNIEENSFELRQRFETHGAEDQARNGKESTLITIHSDNEEDNLALRQLLRGPRYFDPQDTLCFRCGNTGHFAGSCTEDARKKACFVCGSLDHEVKDCPQSCCLICQGTGHFSKACPNKGSYVSRLRERGNLCLRCGHAGHEMASCDREYEPEELQRIQCYVCREYGHLCCVDVALTSERQDTCYNCGEVGHTGVGCARIRGTLEHDRKSETVCYRCGEIGHFARGCRKRDEDVSWDDYGTPSTGFQLPTDGFQGFRSVPAAVGAQKGRHSSEFFERSTNTSPVRWPERWNMEEGDGWKGNRWKHKHHRSSGSTSLNDDVEYSTPAYNWSRHTSDKKFKYNKAHGHVEVRKSYSCGKRFWRKHNYH